jgi:hypothetical protein
MKRDRSKKRDGKLPPISGREIKADVARVVTGCLHEYLVNGRIASKDDFKHLAREITHKWCAKLDGKREALSEERLRAKIKQHVARQFEKSFIYVRVRGSQRVDPTAAPV